ncbi:Adenylate kinase, chloroplastic [Auxenochlorella protothecoides]|nr:Adenylate kinase, chloroplastic [Auxenochlorella protothecoides]KFM24831.1 Adenylate kinase, chloroplastic [Auxenochlorella protothecoides]RMZ52620.1 hypothetical protein APUTEX25_000739 [Auxenochlorella protothecoides]|eukprot:RMZ52620.1 hypothetical protein APUTEX25_000739 [Auxenochlorella protothecoides]
MGDAPLRVMISGAPAAGKGTQCASIVEDFGLTHISAGDLLRAEVSAGTPAGKRASEFMTAGKLVPNEVVVDMVVGALSSGEAARRGWLLDGYPRSPEQAQAIDRAGIRPDVFLLLNVPDDALVARVVGRRLDPVTGDIYHLTFRPPPTEVAPRLVQRSDDTEEAVRTRLATYHANLDAVLGFYPDQIVQIDGARSMPEVYADIRAALDAAVASKALRVAAA